MELKKDPLDTLFTMGDEVDRQLLRDILFPYVRLDENGHIFPLPSFYREPNKQKLILLLLARKTIFIKIGIDEFCTPSELAKFADIPGGSVRPILRALVDEQIVDVKNGRYRLFSNAIPRCVSIILKPEGKETLSADSVDLIKKPVTKLSMRSTIEDLIKAGFFIEEKSFSEIFQEVARRRPGTKYNALYKVVIDLYDKDILGRHLRADTWVYGGEKL